MYPPDKVAACRKQLEASADLRQYATSNAVDDLEAVRRALGYQAIDLQAISYGTRLALEYARRYPDHVRTLTAIGSLPPEHRIPLRHAVGFERAFNRLLADCEGDNECRSAYPDLRERWLALLKKMAEPVVYRYQSSSLEDGGIDLTIRRDIFVEELRSAMYYATQARSLPHIVDAASRGDFEPFLKLALPTDPDAPPFLAEGAYLSFTCTDDVSRINAADVAPYVDDTYLGDYRISQQIRACELWPSGSFPDALASRVESDVPALLLTGDRDPITPPSDAKQMARWLTNSLVVIIPHAGHLPFDGSNPECIDRLMLAFLQSATLDGLDTACVFANEPPPFSLN
jgi:pimeloyl-ACP methyl ester carboxylesterase